MLSLYGSRKLISRANRTLKFSNWKIPQLSWTCWRTKMISWDSVLKKPVISLSDKTKNWRTSKRLQSKYLKMLMQRCMKLWKGLDWELSVRYSVKSSSGRPSMASKGMSISRKTRLRFSRECLCPAARNGGRSSQSISMITSIKKLKKSYLASLKSIKRSTISSLSNASCKACSFSSATWRNAASSNGSLTKTNRTWDGGIPGSLLKFVNLIWQVSMPLTMQVFTAISSDAKRQKQTQIT